MRQVRVDDATVVQQPLRLLVSLHDVTPAHTARLERAERLLARMGIPVVAYLLVPNFHGRWPAHDNRDFIGWCRTARPYAVEWFLHGNVHEETAQPVTAATSRETLNEWFARRFLTGGEGEFLALRGRALDERLDAAIASFGDTIGRPPDGFVAPAWLFNEQLLPALARRRLLYAESHLHLFHVAWRRAIAAPVITWAARSAFLRAGSRFITGVERRLLLAQPVVRIALHPADFDHPRIVDSIDRCLDALRSRRRIVGVHAVWRGVQEDAPMTVC